MPFGALIFGGVAFVGFSVFTEFFAGFVTRPPAFLLGGFPGAIGLTSSGDGSVGLDSGCFCSGWVAVRLQFDELHGCRCQ